MNINAFRRWLRSQIRLFDDDTDTAVDRADETVPVIREAQKFAIELGLPDVAQHCAAVTTKMLALPVARLVLCECLASLPSAPNNGLLSLREAANLLGYTEKGLRKIVARKGIDYFQSKPWAAIKFKREWIESFIDNHTKKTPTYRRKVKPLTFDEF